MNYFNFGHSTDDFCQNLDENLLKQNEQRRNIFITIGCISTLSTASVAAIMWFNKKLMAFPNQLIFYTCIAESIACYNCVVALLGTEHVICHFGMYKSLS